MAKFKRDQKIIIFSHSLALTIFQARCPVGFVEGAGLTSFIPEIYLQMFFTNAFSIQRLVPGPLVKSAEPCMSPRLFPPASLPPLVLWTSAGSDLWPSAANGSEPGFVSVVW